MNIETETYMLPDHPSDDPDTIGIEGTMKYLGDIGVNLDEVVVLAVLTELSAPTMGELSREGFTSGWKTYGCKALTPTQT